MCVAAAVVVASVVVNTFAEIDECVYMRSHTASAYVYWMKS